MENNRNNTRNGSGGKNNKPTDVKQDNKNKSGANAQNVKQDNKNSACRNDKLFNDTAVGGNKPSRNRRDDDDSDI